MKLLSQYKIIVSSLLVASLTLSACGGKNDKAGISAKPAQQTTRSIAIDDSLRSRLAQFIAAPRVQGQFAVHVYDLTAGKPVFGYNETKSLPSASCMKLLTGIAGLKLMGTAYNYSTSIYTKGQVNGNTLQGDIALKGSLDPQLNGPDLSMFAQALANKGIRNISGKCFIDLVVSEPVTSEQHWYPWDLSFSRYGVFYKGAPRVAKEFKYALRSRGIAVADSQVVTGRVPQGAQCLFRFHRPISLVVERMWKNSSNTQATAMLYTIGHQVNPTGDPVSSGVNYLRQFLRTQLHLTDTAIVVHDGCGLCTYNHLSPVALTTILRYGHENPPIYAQLCKLLSVSGVDGTLRREMSSPDLRGKIKGKTGTLSHPYGISSLAGYCQGNNGHTLAFAIMASEMSVLDAHVLQRKFCKELVK